MGDALELAYTDDALLTRVLFLSSTKSVNIFVEDINKEYEYEEIFERLFNDEIKVSCIFPTGGKPSLENAYSLFGNSPEYGKSFFIADGDFDIALGRNQINAPNIVYLSMYNIECYLIEEEATIRFMRPKLKLKKDEARLKINFQSWKECILPFFEKIFILHLIVQKNSSYIENVGRNPNCFLNETGHPRETYLAQYENEIKENNVDLDNIYEECQDVFHQVYGCNQVNGICGKYLLESLKSYLNNKIRKKINVDELKAGLIKDFDITKLDYVKTKLYTYLSN